jgi:hypothetical protein
MEQIKKDSIRMFFETVERLKDEEIIRSTKYLGDIAEYICQELYALTLSSSQREIGFDASDIDGNTYQIKINNSSEKTNQDIGDISVYNNLLLIVTSNSLLFDSTYPNAFMLIYNIPSNTLTGNAVAKTILRGLRPDKMLDRNLNIITA